MIQVNGNTTIASVVFNGNELSKVFYNDIMVYPDISNLPFTVKNNTDEPITWKWTSTGSPAAFIFYLSDNLGKT